MYIARRVPLAGLIFLLLLNLTGLLPLASAAAAAAQAAGTLTVAPARAEAGAAIGVGGADFAPGEPLDALVVTPHGQTLALVSSGGTPPTLAIGEATGAPLTADARGAVAFTLRTAANYQAGEWAIVVRGRTSGASAGGGLTLAAPTVAAATFTPPGTPVVTPVTPPARPSPVPEPTATTPPPAPAPPATVAPTAAPPAAPSPTLPAPSVAPSAAPAPATPAVAASPSPAPNEVPAPSATPSAAPTATPSASPAPSAPPAPVPTAAPSAGPAAASPTPGGFAPGATVVVSSPSGTATVRESPSLRAGSVRVVNNGTVLTVTGASVQADDYIWWPVAGEGVAGWLPAPVLALAPTAPASPDPLPSNEPAPSPLPPVPSPATGTVPGPAPSAGATASPSPAPAPAAPPVDNGPSIPPPAAGPALAPAQLMVYFERAAALTGVPKEILLAIGRVESGFDPRAVGPFIPFLAGTENERALGMMQFLPGTYRMVMPRVDATTGKNLGMQGIWDAESSIYAAAFYLQDSGAPGDLRRALFAYNNAEWYVDLIISWANHYAGNTIIDPSIFDPNRNGAPPTLAAPQNPLLPKNTRHLDMLSPIPLYAPWTAGQTWYGGGDGSFYGDGYHTDSLGNYYTVDFNKGTWPRSEEDDGEPVLAAADGIVNNIYQDAAGAWVVELYHIAPDGSQLRTLYVHLKADPRLDPGIRTNQAVPHGTPIGRTGSTGNSTGPHLHFGLWMLRDGQWMSIRPEPMEGQYLQNGLSIVSTNRPPAEGTVPRVLDTGFAPLGPSNADRVTVAAAARPGTIALDRIEVYANTAKDGSDRGQWLAVGTVAGERGEIAWTTAPIADGTYRLLFVMIDAGGNQTAHGLTAETAVRYTVRRGEPRGSIVAHPRADLTLLAPLDGAALAPLGTPGPTISGPLRFAPVAGARPATAALGAGAFVVGTGAGSSGKVREGRGLVIEEATTNLVTNPSFERGAEGWTARSTPDNSMTVLPVDGGLFGQRAIRLDNSKGTAPAIFTTVAGDGGAATWSVYARGVRPPEPSPSPSASPSASPAAATGTTRTISGGPRTEVALGNLGLGMAGLNPQEWALTGEWQRLAFSGASGTAGAARQIIVPPGTIVELDGAQLEAKPYATSYADGALGPGYGWDRAADASLSGRLPTVLAQPLDGLVAADRGALSFWATPTGPSADGALLLAFDRLTVAIANDRATLRWANQELASVPWVPGETHHYAVTWEGTTLSFLRDGAVAGEINALDFGLVAGATLYLGADVTGARAANVALQDLALWRGVPEEGIFATIAAGGEFLRPGLGETVVLNVALALATQGLAPTGTTMQFSFDGATWTDPEPFAPTKALLLPDGAGEVRIYVRFTDGEGRTIVVADRLQIVPPPKPGEDGSGDVGSR